MYVLAKKCTKMVVKWPNSKVVFSLIGQSLALYGRDCDARKDRKNATTGNFYLAFVGVKLSKYHFPKKEAAKASFFHSFSLLLVCVKSP